MTVDVIVLVLLPTRTWSATDIGTARPIAAVPNVAVHSSGPDPISSTTPGMAWSAINRGTCSCSAAYAGSVVMASSCSLRASAGAHRSVEGSRRPGTPLCLAGWMTDDQPPTVVTASRLIAADDAAIFELIADPARQPEWDANDNLVESAPGHRVRAVGDTFETLLTMGSTRVNHVVEFDEGRRIAWQPAE